MANLKIITNKDTDSSLCYVCTEAIANEKVEQAILNYEFIDEAQAADILQAYSQFVDFGAKDTPSYIFSNGNFEDWYTAQVVIKETNAS